MFLSAVYTHDSCKSEKQTTPGFATIKAGKFDFNFFHYSVTLTGKFKSHVHDAVFMYFGRINQDFLSQFTNVFVFAELEQKNTSHKIIAEIKKGKHEPHHNFCNISIIVINQGMPYKSVIKEKALSVIKRYLD